MSRRNKIRWLGMAIIAGVLAIGIVRLNSEKPVGYAGKTASEWVALLDPDVNRHDQREQASTALMRIGAAALRDIEHILSRRQQSMTEVARGYAVRLRLVKPPPLSLVELQSRACEAAYVLAERADVDIHSLVPHLMFHFTNGTYTSSNSGRALAQAGPNGIASLTNLLAVGPRPVRDEAGWSLHHQNRRPEVVAALIRSADSDTDPKIRANALLYLKRSRAGR
jgi:hypothetical protein